MVNSYEEIFSNDRITEFLDINENPSSKDINKFMDILEEEDLVFNRNFLGSLIQKRAYYENAQELPVYNLDFDPELKEAINIINQ